MWSFACMIHLFFSEEFMKRDFFLIDSHRLELLASYLY